MIHSIQQLVVENDGRAVLYIRYGYDRTNKLSKTSVGVASVCIESRSAVLSLHASVVSLKSHTSRLRLLPRHRTRLLL